MSLSITRTSSLLLASALLLVASCDKGPSKDASKEAEVAAGKTAEPAAAPAVASGDAESKTYGAGVSQSETVSIADISKDPEAYEGKTVRVEGMVTDVCVKRGCWFEMAGNAPGEKMRFKVTDGEMVFPVDSKGKWAVAEGKLVTSKLTVEEARAQAEHLAQEAGQEFDPSTITEGIVSFQIAGTGAVIGDKK